MTSASRSIAVTCFFLSASSLKRLNAWLSVWPRDLVAQVHQRRLQRVAAGVLAEHDRAGVVDADRLGGHDLVGRALLQHAVLVDAGLVLERVAARRRPCWAARA